MKTHAAIERKIRISYSDPDATDSSSCSSDEERPSMKPKRVVHEIAIDKPRMSSVLSAFLRKRKNFKRVGSQKWRKRFNGGLRRKPRKYAAQFRCPITAAEVSRAFLSKKIALEKLFMMAHQEVQPVVSQESYQESFYDSSSSVAEVKGSDTLGTEQYVPVSYGVVVNGEFVQFSAGFLVNSAVPYYLPVVDNHGFLLGEFSRLDDLSICNSEEDRALNSLSIPKV